MTATIFSKQMATGIGKLLTSRGTAMNMEGTIKLVNGFSCDCGLKPGGKEKMEAYKVAVIFLFFTTIIPTSAGSLACTSPWSYSCA